MVTFVSVLMTAAALLGFSLAPSFLWLCIPAVPLGLGAGAVDAALNNFVALHYKVSHMNWLHCFWGLGAMSGPMIISVFLQEEQGWRKGYRTISVIQFVLVLILLGTLFLWKKFENKDTDRENEAARSHSGLAGFLLLLRGRTDGRPVGQQLSGKSEGNLCRYGSPVDIPVLYGYHPGQIPVRLFGSQV